MRNRPAAASLPTRMTVTSAALDCDVRASRHQRLANTSRARVAAPAHRAGAARPRDHAGDRRAGLVKLGAWTSSSVLHLQRARRGNTPGSFARSKPRRWSSSSTQRGGTPEFTTMMNQVDRESPDAAHSRQVMLSAVGEAYDDPMRPTEYATVLDALDCKATVPGGDITAETLGDTSTGTSASGSPGTAIATSARPSRSSSTARRRTCRCRIVGAKSSI